MIWGWVDGGWVLDVAGIAAAVVACPLNPCPGGATACPEPAGDTCTLTTGEDGTNVDCGGAYTALPTEQQWGRHSVAAVNGALDMDGCCGRNLHVRRRRSN